MAQDPNNSNILGPTAGIDAGSAAELLAARISAVSQSTTTSGDSATSGANLNSEDALNVLLAENQAAAAGPQDAYAEARRITQQATMQARNEYADMGLYDLAANNSPIFKDYTRRVQQQALYSSGYADTPDLPLAPTLDTGGPTLYDSARHVDRQTEAELREEYTGRGLYNQIGGEGYKEELGSRQRQAQYEAGYTNSPDAPTPHSESMKDILGGLDMAYAYAYGGMQAISAEQRAFAPMVSGESYLPGQVNEQAETGLLPLVGAVGGTLLGLRGGPAAGLAGQYIGQSAGQGLEETIDQYTTGHIFAQERAGQSIGEGQGGADAVKELTTALQSALTPAAKELAETLTSLSRSAPVGTAAAGEFGQFQFGMGTAFAANAQGEEQFLSSNPYLAPIRNTFNNNPFTGLSASDYLGNAAAAAQAGDYGGMKASFAFAETETERNTSNPTYQRDDDFVKRREGEGIFQKGIEDLFEPSRVRAYNVARQRLTTETADGPGAASARQALGQQEDEIREEWMRHTLDTADVSYGASLLGGDSATLSGTLARGGGSAAMYAALPGLRRDASVATSALGTDIADNEADAARHPLQRAVFMANVASDREQSAKISASLDASAKAAFTTGLGEEDANFSLYTDRYTLSGRSAASMQPGFERQEAFLSGTAADPSNPLSPTERSQIAQSAIRMRYTEAQAVYGEENAGLGITRAGRQADIARADILGSPADAYNAGVAGLQSDRDQIAQNSSEISRGNLTRPQILDLQRQNVGLQSDLDTGPERLRVAAYDAQGGILANTQSADRAELSRTQSVYGAKAFTPGVFADDQNDVNLYAGAEAGSPLGSSQRARFGAERADAAARLQSDRDSSYEFGDQGTRVRDFQAEGKFRRAEEAPYLDGSPESSPFTAGTALLGVYRSDLARAQTALKATPQDSPTYEKNAEAVEQYQDKIAGVEQERRTGFLRALPEFIGGSPGQGNLSGVLPTPGQSAYYNSNPFISGTFGQPDRNLIHDGSGNTAQAGGQVGAFLDASSLAGSGADAGIGALTTEIKRLNDNLQRGSIGGRSPAQAGQPSGYSQNVNLQTNAYRSGG